MRSSVEHLLHDHRRIEALLNELESLLDAKTVVPAPTPEAGLAFLHIVRRFTELVLPYLCKEDEILFPALEEFLPREEGPLAVLRAEQSSLWTQFNRMRATGLGLFAADAPPELSKHFQRSGRATLQILRDHIYKQDRILFPLAARLLSPECDARLLSQMEVVSRRFDPEKLN